MLLATLFTFRSKNCHSGFTKTRHFDIQNPNYSNNNNEWAVKHVGTISSSCFYWLRQIRRIRRSLDAESAKTLVHAFITSRIDGCNTVLAGSPRTIIDMLQRLLNDAALVVNNTRKFGRGLTYLLHSELHGLDVPQRILHKLGVTVSGRITA